MLQSQKKLTFKCYRGTLIQTPENLATHYRSATKLSPAVFYYYFRFFFGERAARQPP